MYLNEMGISTNEDDSTNNITDSFRYNRDHLLQRIDLTYVLSQVWALFSAFIIFFFSFRLLEGPVNSAGLVNDKVNCATNAYFVLITSHFIQVFIETRNYSPMLFTIYLISYLLYNPLTVWMNDKLAKEN